MEADLGKAVRAIREEKAENVLLQFPEGLKPKALRFKDKIEEETGCQVFIWAGTCYGACDIPNVDVDILIQVGHTPLR